MMTREGFMSTIFIKKRKLDSGAKITIIITKKKKKKLEAIVKITERNKR